jgi:hypothetical protein
MFRSIPLQRQPFSAIVHRTMKRLSFNALVYPTLLSQGH